jgi:hypothetical protein
MIYEYKFLDYSPLGLPTIEVYGDKFHYQDLYELVGKNKYMTTFDLKIDTDTYSAYGDSILGTVNYDKKSLEKLEESLKSNEVIDNKIICIKVPLSGKMSIEERKKLKYQGIKIDDIKKISYIAYSQKIEKYDTGEKKIQNRIEIKVDFDGWDSYKLNQNYLTMKYNDGVNLIDYEKEQLIGINLAFREGVIDSRIIKELGYTQESVKNNNNVWMSYFKVKENRKTLTEEDKKNYTWIKDSIVIENLKKVVNEVKKAKDINNLDVNDGKVLSKIFQEVETFTPSILLHQKKQIYWDIDSCIHIVLRHLKDYQLGVFKDKTHFLYKEDDLKSLIEQVLSSIDGEIEHHYQTTNKIFRRHGKMAVIYNNDYYHLRIDENGKLLQFHMVENNK